MRKALILRGQDPVVDALLAQGDELQERGDQELSFLRKQYANAKDRLQVEAQDLAKQIETHFIALGKLPKEYQPKNPEHHLVFEKDTGVLYACMGHEQQPSLEMIIGSLINRD